MPPPVTAEEPSQGDVTLPVRGVVALLCPSRHTEGASRGKINARTATGPRRRAWWQMEGSGSLATQGAQNVSTKWWKLPAAPSTHCSPPLLS